MTTKSGPSVVTWRFLAITAFGMLLGGTPSHVAMLFQKTEDHDIVMRNQSDIAEIKESLREVSQIFREQAKNAAALDKQVGIITQQFSDYIKRTDGK